MLRLAATLSLALASLLVPAHAGDVKISVTDAAITITEGENALLTYHRTDVPPPAGADPVYRRSGFIHPLRTPKGGVVTGIHPGDHIHHVGIWHAWVNTQHGKRKPDFWNLKKKTGTVRHAKVLATREMVCVQDARLGVAQALMEHPLRAAGAEL